MFLVNVALPVVNSLAFTESLLITVQGGQNTKTDCYVDGNLNEGPINHLNWSSKDPIIKYGP